MSNSFEQRLERLRQAQGDPHAMALVALDFLLEAQSEARSARLRRAIEAAAVPHWFDAPILAALLGETESNARELVELLRTFPMVEPFGTRDSVAYNVHETTRLALRKYLFANDPDRLRRLSICARELVGTSKQPQMVAERLYHQFLADPERAGDECENLFRDWSTAAEPASEQFLRGVLDELRQTGLVNGRALAEVLVTIGWIGHARRDTTALLETLANEALDLARAAELSLSFLQS